MLRRIARKVKVEAKTAIATTIYKEPVISVHIPAVVAETRCSILRAGSLPIMPFFAEFSVATAVKAIKAIASNIVMRSEINRMTRLLCDDLRV
ncbi:MAG: hypothetical protein Q8933_17880 [Bacteroidota bacterium]|nr:hypothetical protein [Bacteroidota bacterium]MDP4192520.1 hypothetical protein [Bacteroidota bacterium]